MLKNYFSEDILQIDQMLDEVLGKRKALEQAEAKLDVAAAKAGVSPGPKASKNLRSKFMACSRLSLKVIYFCSLLCLDRWFLMPRNF